MRLKNILLVVDNIEKSKAFYRELFGLEVLTDFGQNVILTEGLVLQEKSLWETSLGRKTGFGGHDAELYFEENCMDTFLETLSNSRFEIEYLDKCEEDASGRRVLRLYDPDQHVIEIAESMEYVTRRMSEKR